MNCIMSDAPTPAFEIPPSTAGALHDARRTAAGMPPSEGAADPGAGPERREISPERLAEIRAQIEAGVYIDENKLDVVVDRLLDELERG